MAILITEIPGRQESGRLLKFEMLHSARDDIFGPTGWPDSFRSRRLEALPLPRRLGLGAGLIDNGRCETYVEGNPTASRLFSPQPDSGLNP